jgi:hypothetical protein
MENLEQLKDAQDANENETTGGENVQMDGSTTQMSTLGKFKDAQSLLTAYNNLQSDYTRKCQALAIVQKQLKEDKPAEPNGALSSGEDEPEKEKLSTLDKDTLLQEYIFSNEELKNKILTKYFDELSLPKSPKLIGGDRGSAPVLSPATRPKTLEQAGTLVKEMFDKK